MLREDNELLWHVGRGTPMGEFMRRFWVPATLSSDIVAGGSPQRLRLLGQNMVAFRAADGRLGVFDEGCPHRGVSLALARSSDCALTCIFHGWKIYVTGKVLDVPPEPAERRDAPTLRARPPASCGSGWATANPACFRRSIGSTCRPATSDAPSA